MPDSSAPQSSRLASGVVASPAVAKDYAPGFQMYFFMLPPFRVSSSPFRKAAYSAAIYQIDVLL